MKFNKEFQETVIAACDFDKAHFVIATKDDIRILRKSDFKKVGRSNLALGDCNTGMLDVCGEETIGRFPVHIKNNHKTLIIRSQDSNPQSIFG